MILSKLYSLMTISCLLFSAQFHGPIWGYTCLVMTASCYKFLSVKDGIYEYALLN